MKNSPLEFGSVLKVAQSRHIVQRKEEDLAARARQVVEAQGQKALIRLNGKY